MILTIDSSVYLSALIPADTFHKISSRFLRAVGKGRQEVVLPLLVPLEVVNTLQRRGAPRGRAIDLFESFFRTPRLKIVAMDYAMASTFVPNVGRFDLRTADWIIAETCRHFDSCLVTWDAELREKTRSILQVKTPS